MIVVCHSASFGAVINVAFLSSVGALVDSGATTADAFAYDESAL